MFVYVWKISASFFRADCCMFPTCSSGAAGLGCCSSWVILCADVAVASSADVFGISTCVGKNLKVSVFRSTFLYTTGIIHPLHVVPMRRVHLDFNLRLIVCLMVPVGSCWSQHFLWTALLMRVMGWYTMFVRVWLSYGIVSAGSPRYGAEILGLCCRGLSSSDFLGS